MKLLSVLLLVVLGWTGAVRADWPAPVRHYQQVLAGVESASAPVSLEPLLQAATAVQDRVMQIEGSRAWLETLSDADYAELGRQLRGIRLSRGLDVYAQPDPAFLLRLAQDHGDDADRAFFEQYRRSWGEDLLPVYLRQTERLTPCVRYDQGVIADRYRAWTGFRADWPQAYAGQVKQTIADLEEVVSLGTCACDDQVSVERELRGFAERFPHSPAVPAITARLHQLANEPTRLPVHCR